MLPRQNIDLLQSFSSPQDPFAFLVMEQIVLAKERSRFRTYTPWELAKSKRARDENARAVRSYQHFCEQCDFLWLQLVRRLMELQIEETMGPFEKRFERKQRYEQHLDQLQELRYEQEIKLATERIRVEPRPHMIAAHEQRLREIVMEQSELTTATEGEVERTRQMNLAEAEHARELFQKVASTELQMTHNSQVALAKLQNEAQERLQALAQAHDYMMNAGKPDKDNPVDMANLNKEALKVYFDMISEFMDDTNLKLAEQRRNIKLVMKLIEDKL
jgi:hypothetical protein